MFYYTINIKLFLKALKKLNLKIKSIEKRSKLVMSIRIVQIVQTSLVLPKYKAIDKLSESIDLSKPQPNKIKDKSILVK